MALDMPTTLPVLNGITKPGHPVCPAPADTSVATPGALEVVALDDILLHEDPDMARATPLVQALARDGVQRHPVVLGRTPEGPLVQLDGANRLTALRRLRCQHVVAQVVDYADPAAVHLSTWMHLTCLPPLSHLHETMVWDALAVEPAASAQSMTMLAQGQAVAVLIGTAVVAVRSGMGLLTRIAVLRQLVEAYAMSAVRVPLQEAASLVTSAHAALARTPCANTAVVFTPLHKADIITLVVELGMTLPAGLTRHVLTCGRVLNVHAPLALLQADLSASEKTLRLQDHLAGQQCRMYAEPTLVYEAG